MTRILSVITLALLLLCAVTHLFAQHVTPYHPDHQEILQRYRQAARTDSLTKNAVLKYTVDAHWVKNGQAFWYTNVLADSVLEYIYVDASSGKKQALFDSRKIASDLATKGITVDPLRIPVDDILQSTDQQVLQLSIEDQWFAMKSGSNKLTSISPPPGTITTTKQREDRPRQRGSDATRNGGVSPDKKWTAYIEKGNVYVKPSGEGTAIKFTDDGSEAQPYGQITWSPDSKYLVGFKIHPVQDSLVHHILTAVPGTTRGQLVSRPYKQPGDPFTSYEIYLFPLETKKAVKVPVEAIDFPHAPHFHWQYDDPRYFTFERFDRGHQRYRIMRVDAQTATAHTLVEETSNTFIYHDRQLTFYPKETNLLIRSSEKDGWRHLYLVDLVNGKEQAITKGNWVVRQIDSVDHLQRQVWFSASGRNANVDPYLVYHYRIDFDGKNLLPLTPDSGNHEATFSPDKKYIIDNYSYTNILPKTKLRRASDGKEIALLEEARLSEAYQQSGVSAPEVFVAKARDGVTDIWGIVSKPSDYDPNKKYPVLENIYAGPHDAFVPKSYVPYSEMQSLAELGFVVVMIDGMGTANRSKAFHDVCWQNLADAGLPDRILWIKALATKYPFVDADRVGIYGTSAGGQNTVSALLFHPEFYKAGVSACGCHDNRVDKQWWNEQWMGYPVGKHYEEQSNISNASKLQGRLLLIVGEADTNVPPESSYRVADALLQAGKDFDFLPIPGLGHSDGGPFGRLKKRDFFVKHLLGVDPPNWNTRELSFTGEMGRERWFFR